MNRIDSSRHDGKRQDHPRHINEILWSAHRFTGLSDAQIARLHGVTPEEVARIRDHYEGPCTGIPSDH